MQHPSAPRSDLPALLRGVSRSFDLSIRLLPRGMREPVGVGYLLARAADTVADAPGIDTRARWAALDMLARAVDANAGHDELRVADEGRHDNSDYAAWHAAMTATTNPHEAALLRALPDCLRALRALPAPDRDDVRTVLDSIVAGQRSDLEHFDGGAVRALATREDVEIYTQRVAGGVGEFWTRIAQRHVRDFATLPPDELMRAGASYGRALQRINILRDAREDLANGRCYFPREELAPLGADPRQLADAPAAFGELWTHWLHVAEDGLRDGMRYACAVNSGRLRAATALPALLGARTVALLRAAGPRALRERVKMPRAEVRRVLAGLVLHLAGRAHLQRTFERLLAGPPAARWDNAGP